MRLRSTTAVLLLAAALLGACGFDGGPPDTAPPSALPQADATAPADPTQTAPADATAEAGEAVTIGFGAQEYERQIYAPLIEAFNQENPGIHVQFVSLDEAMRPAEGQELSPDTMMRQMVGAADTISAFFVRPEDIENGYVRDLTPLIDADAEFERADFYPGALEQNSRDGAIYMIPHSLRVSLLSYNKDLWTASGLPAPKPDWTMQDMLAAAEQLAKKRGDKVEVYGLLDWGSAFTALFGELGQAGIDLFSAPADKARLDRPEIAAALGRIAGLAQSGAIYFQPSEVGGAISSDSFQKLIVDGQVGMWRSEMIFSGPGGDKPTFAVGTAPFPALPGPYALNAQGYIMSGGTEHPQEAWRWLAYLSKQAIKPPYAGPDDVSEVPARRSIAEASGYWTRLDGETKAVVEAILARPPTPATSFGDHGRFLFEALNQAINEAVAGQKRPEQILREAQAKFEQQVAQAQLTPQPTVAAGPIIVATPKPAVVAQPGAATISFGWAGGFDDRARKLAETFNQEHPEIFVEIKEPMFSNGPVSLAGVAGANDCFSWFGPPEPNEITATLDLQPLIDADPSFDLSDYPAALLAPFKRGGLYGLPSTISFRVLVYNKEAFDRAGLSYPSAEWTADDFLNAAQKLTTGGDKDKHYGYATDGPQTQDLLLFLKLFGAAPTQGSGEAQKPNFTDAKVIQAIQFYLRLLRDYSPHKEFRGYKRGEMFGGELFDLIRAGRVGMTFDYGNRFFFGPGEQPKYTRAIAPPPLGNSSLSSNDFNPRGLFISAGTQQPQACWTWLKYLSEHASSFEDGFPARISVAESDAYLQRAPAGSAEVYRAYRAAMERAPGAASPDSDIFRSPIDFFWLFRAIDRALQGKDLERELAGAQKLTEQFLGCTRSGAEPAVCAKQVDPSYEGWKNADQP